MAASQALFREVPLTHAEDLLDEIAIHRGRLWEPEGADTEWDWIFRGQRNENWGLKPSALRPGSLLEFVPGLRNAYPLTPQEQRDLEEKWVLEFVSGVNAQGLEVPGDRPELRDKDLRRPTNNAWDFPWVGHHFFYALAQHYGVPTRFLDWSHSPQVAAYFACADLARDRTRDGEKQAEPFAIWALSRLFIDQLASKWEPFVKIVTVPTASNPNLRAQQGLFTLCGFRRPGSGDLNPPDLDALFATQRYERDDDPQHYYPGPVLVKFTLPATEARVLLRLLAIDGVSAASTYPGHAGVVKSMWEKKWHQVAPQGSRGKP